MTYLALSLRLGLHSILFALVATSHFDGDENLYEVKYALVLRVFDAGSGELRFKCSKRDRDRIKITHVCCSANEGT